VVAGYNEDICVECTNGDQISTLDSIDITQIRDCSTSLASQPTAPLDPTYNYMSSGGTEIAGDWTTFFTNADSTNCPVTSC